jgi:hypothetical protein
MLNGHRCTRSFVRALGGCRTQIDRLAGTYPTSLTATKRRVSAPGAPTIFRPGLQHLDENDLRASKLVQGNAGSCGELRGTPGSASKKEMQERVRSHRPPVHLSLLFPLATRFDPPQDAGRRSTYCVESFTRNCKTVGARSSKRSKGGRCSLAAMPS